MDFGLRGGQHAYRPYAASLPVRVPTVKGLFPASFGLAARLAPRDFRSAVPYGYLHRSRQARFILLESAHAGHTGARLPAGRVGLRAGVWSSRISGTRRPPVTDKQKSLQPHVFKHLHPFRRADRPENPASIC